MDAPAPRPDARDPTVTDAARAAVAGDEATLQVFLRRHELKLMHYVRARMGRDLRARELTCDVVQSACREFLQGLAEAPTADEERLCIRLYRAAHRKVMERGRYHRALRRAVAREQIDPDVAPAAARALQSPDGEPLATAIAREQHERLQLAFAELAAVDQEIVALHCFAGVEHGAIAAELGLSEPAVKSRLHRARARLARLLASGTRASAE